MDGLKPANHVPRTGLVRASPGSVLPTAHTELSPSRTVTASSDGAPQGRYNPPQDGHPQPQSAHDYLIDPQAREVIYRAVAVDGGAGDNHNPTDTALKLRAYRSPQVDDDGAGAHNSLEKTA